jgi:hypothetical protein
MADRALDVAEGLATYHEQEDRYYLDNRCSTGCIHLRRSREPEVADGIPPPPSKLTAEFLAMAQGDSSGAKPESAVATEERLQNDTKVDSPAWSYDCFEWVLKESERLAQITALSSASSGESTAHVPNPPKSNS